MNFRGQKPPYNRWQQTGPGLQLSKDRGPVAFTEAQFTYTDYGI